MQRKCVFIVLLCIGLLTSLDVLHAQESEDVEPSNQQEEAFIVGEEQTMADGEQAMAAFNDLIAVMEQTTEIATTTKLNADFVPGMVTVLDGNDLESRGIHRVIDALSLVPGLDKSFSDPVVRGISKWGSGKVKILIDGVNFSESTMASANPPYLLPIAMVDRIEIIRGPGSAVYGEYAYTGVINVITRKQGKRVYGLYSDFNTYEGGGLFSHHNPEKRVSFSLNMSGFTTDGDDVQSGEDALYTQFGQPGISNAPGPSNEKEQQRSAFLTFTYKDFTLLSQYVWSGQGNAFWMLDVLPPPEKRIVWEEKQQGFELRQSLDLADSLKSNFKLGWWENSIEMDRNPFTPPGFYVKAPTEEEVIALLMEGKMFPDDYPFYHADGIIASTYAHERKLYGGAHFTWSGLDKHLLTFGMDYADIKLDDVRTEGNILNDPTMVSLFSWQVYPEEREFVKEGVGRTIWGAMIQDQYEVGSRLTLTTGLRFDHYDDVGDAVAPRIAAVYRLSDHHILKAQFGRAFRPPTFMEMYALNFVLVGNPEIEPETIDTYELGYIYRDEKSVGRVTVFHSAMDDLIAVVGGEYLNTSGADLNGVELEFERSLTSSLKLDTNLSYVTTEDKETGEEVGDVANWMANVGLLWQPQSDYVLSVQYRFVGEHYREPDDTRNKMDSNHTVALTGTLFNLWKSGLILRGGAKNLFDSNVPVAAPANSYLDDYPLPGRELWAQLGYEF